MSKKDFKNNPAMQFVTTGKQEQETEVPEGFKKNPEYIEVKKKRVQLVMQPSLYEKAKKQAESEGLSFNAYIHKILVEYLEEYGRISGNK